MELKKKNSRREIKIKTKANDNLKPNINLGGRLLGVKPSCSTSLQPYCQRQAQYYTNNTPLRVKSC